jgi:dTDP-4-amino-4,6-dideoxygalactose transaminase
VTVPFLDLTRSWPSFADAARGHLDAIFATQRFILGEHGRLLEEELASATGRRFGVGVSSGTDAILLCLMALDLAPGDEVITTPFTFFATAGCIVRAGGTPVFVDIDPGTFNIDPAAIRSALTPKTKAIVTVDLYGQCADYDAILALADEVGVPVIEDACQAIGGIFGGRPAGAFGLASCFSFFPTKNLGGAGDGGMITLDDEALAKRLRSLRTHGETTRYHHAEVGINGRLDEIQAAVLRAKLPHLAAWNADRRTTAAFYSSRLAGIPGVTVPLVDPRCVPIWHQYTLRLTRRDAVLAALQSAGIGCGVYYPVPLHLQPCFSTVGGLPGSLPETEHAAREVLSLPIFPGLTDAEREEVVAAVAGAS